MAKCLQCRKKIESREYGRGMAGGCSRYCSYECREDCIRGRTPAPQKEKEGLSGCAFWSIVLVVFILGWIFII